MRFPSIGNPKARGYIWDSENNYTRQGIHYNAKQFDTYGDNQTQHSPGYGVPMVNLIDYLESLAIYIGDHPDEIKELENWPIRPFDRKDAKFLLGLRYDENKTKYYDKIHLKVSTTENKKFDKRWEEIPSWADGSFKAVYQMMAQPHHMILDALQLYLRIEAWFADEFSWHSAGNNVFSEIMNKPWDYDFNWAVTSPLMAINSFVEAELVKNRAMRSVENITRNIAKRKEEGNVTND